EMAEPCPAGGLKVKLTYVGKVPTTPEVVDIAPSWFDRTVVPAGLNCTTPSTSQSPAVREILVMLVCVPLVIATERALDEIYSPTLPALALLLVVVPTIPFVWLGVKLPVALRVVKA